VWSLRRSGDFQPQQIGRGGVYQKQTVLNFSFVFKINPLTSSSKTKLLWRPQMMRARVTIACAMVYVRVTIASELHAGGASTSMM